MIESNETKLTGKWIFTDGIVKEDDISKRIKDLVVNYLLEIATDESGWYKLYKDPNDHRYWELSYPQSDLQGGGPPLLTNLSKVEAKERYHF